MSFDMGGALWPGTVRVTNRTGEPERVVSVGVFAARADSAVVRSDSDEPVPIAGQLDGQPTADFHIELAGPSTVRREVVDAGGRTVYMTGRLEPGRYTVVAVRGGARVSAGRLHVRAAR